MQTVGITASTSQARPDHARQGLQRRGLLCPQRPHHRGPRRPRHGYLRAAAAGEPWQHYDRGHGYCSYSFFEQCPHRMACARCAFYLPKDSANAQALEAKANLQHMLASIPLTDDERAAVEGDIAVLDRLVERLADVPTPAGPSPRELDADRRKLLPVIVVSAPRQTGKKQ